MNKKALFLAAALALSACTVAENTETVSEDTSNVEVVEEEDTEFVAED